MEEIPVQLNSSISVYRKDNEVPSEEELTSLLNDPIIKKIGCDTCEYLSKAGMCFIYSISIQEIVDHEAYVFDKKRYGKVNLASLELCPYKEKDRSRHGTKKNMGYR